MNAAGPKDGHPRAKPLEKTTPATSRAIGKVDKLGVEIGHAQASRLNVRPSNGSTYNHPSKQRATDMYLLTQIIIGIIAGWLAGKIMRGRGFGLLGDLVVGIVGSLIGGFVFSLLGLASYGLIGSIVVATVGAMLLLYLVRLLK